MSIASHRCRRDGRARTAKQAGAEAGPPESAVDGDHAPTRRWDRLVSVVLAAHDRRVPF